MLLTILSAIIVGLIVGALARLIVPAGKPRIANASLEAAALQRLHQPAFAFDLLEDRPRRLRQIIAQFLDRPRAARCVDHAAKIAFFLRDDLRVAGKAASELARQAHGVGEVSNGDDICSAHAGGEAGCGVAQDVHPRIAAREHAARGDGLERHAGGGAGGGG